MYKNLREFLDDLEKKGEVRRIRHEVSPYLEISRYTDGESKSPGGGKALFFERVKGSAFPVCTNIFGSEQRICMALGVKDLDELGAGIRKYIEFHPPGNLKEIIRTIPMALELTRFFPRTFRGKTPPCQEVILRGEEVNLAALPVLHCWPKDAGPFVTLPLVITRSLETGKRNTGMYRLQIFDKNTTGMHWHIHKDGSHYYNEYRNAGKRMPVAVAIGADPATVYAATAPMPRGLDEMMLAGFIRKKPVGMAKCVSIDLEVPAEAEFVLEGYVNPDELRREGPFGDHTGYYSLADNYPVFHVTALTHRKDAIYNATLVGRPPMEDCYLAKATERLFLPMLQTVFPEIRDYWFPWEGVFHNIVIISLEKEYAGHAQKIMSGLWGQGQMSFCKAIVVVDKDVNPGDPAQVMAALINNLDTASDITLGKGILDVLDHSSPFPNFGNKIGLDLTSRCSGEPPRNRKKINRQIPSPDGLVCIIRAGLPGASACRCLFPEYSQDSQNRILLLSVSRQEQSGRDFAHMLCHLAELEMFNIFILYDEHIDLEDNSLILWKLFNNTDPGRDIFAENHRVVLDACVKGPADGHDREWPDELTFDV